MAKKYRFPLRTEWHRLRKQGQIYQFPFFAIILKNNDLEFSRFAFIVSKKIHKRAVKRNRIKRLLRESIQLLLPRLKSNFDVVFLVKKEILGKDFQQVRSMVKKALKKGGL